MTFKNKKPISQAGLVTRRIDIPWPHVALFWDESSDKAT